MPPTDDRQEKAHHHHQHHNKKQKADLPPGGAGQAAGPPPKTSPKKDAVLAEPQSTKQDPKKDAAVKKRKFADIAYDVFSSMHDHHSFPHRAEEDARENIALDAPSAQTASPSYRLAFSDSDFLLRDDMRATRLSLEYQKVETALSESGIHGTIVIFGSARLQPGTEYYEHARELAKLVASNGKEHGVHIMSGGGPGIMQAANQGAHEAGAKNIGLNIVLPYEQHPNPYITPDLCFSFHYFSIRKMHLLLRAKALLAFPGGFGTLDELFETLTLIQTGKMDRIPVILYGTKFWKKIVNMEALVQEGVISPADLDLFKYADSPTEATDIIAEFYKRMAQRRGSNVKI